MNKFITEITKISQVPMSVNCKIEKDEDSKNVDQNIYRSIIGSLLYFMSCRLDNMPSVCLCAWFEENPKESHMKAIKMIKYINGTCDYELWYHRGIHFELYASTDSDCARSRSNQKSTSGAYYFLGNCLLAS